MALAGVRRAVRQRGRRQEATQAQTLQAADQIRLVSIIVVLLGMGVRWVKLSGARAKRAEWMGMLVRRQTVAVGLRRPLKP